MESPAITAVIFDVECKFESGMFPATKCTSVSVGAVASHKYPNGHSCRCTE